VSNRRKTRMTRAQLEQLAADWERARAIEQLALAQPGQQEEQDDGR